MAYSQILFEVEDRVATITLNRPEHMNTWTSVMSGELSQAMHRCNDDDEIRAVVLTGAGVPAPISAAVTRLSRVVKTANRNPTSPNCCRTR